MLIEVIQPYSSKYPSPICFDVGVTVQVERGDPEYPGWFWCRAPSGTEGWVHHSFLATPSGTTKSIKAYSAKELTVTGGERGTLTHSLDGWVFVRLNAGDEGWLPSSHIRGVEI